MAGYALRSLGMTHEKIRKVYWSLQAKPTPASDPNNQISSEAEGVIDRAWGIAQEMKHSYVGTEHILLALAEMTSQNLELNNVMTELKLDYQHIRYEVETLLGSTILDFRNTGFDLKSPPDCTPQANCQWSSRVHGERCPQGGCKGVPIENLTKDPDSKRGLYQRYVVSKSDGTPIDPKAEYFILRLDPFGSDPWHINAGRAAVLLYAQIIEKILPELAKDLREKYSDNVPMIVDNTHPVLAVYLTRHKVEDLSKDIRESLVMTGELRKRNQEYLDTILEMLKSAGLDITQEADVKILKDAGPRPSNYIAKLKHDYDQLKKRLSWQRIEPSDVQAGDELVQDFDGTLMKRVVEPDVTIEKALLTLARSLHANKVRGQGLHNIFYGLGGIATKLFRNEQERKGFSATPEYQMIRSLINLEEDIPTGTISELERRIGGPVAYHFGDRYVLRDDLEIRKNAEIEPSQAYSLFHLEDDNTFLRVEVFAGSLEWAVREAKKRIENGNSPGPIGFDNNSANTSEPV